VRCYTKMMALRVVSRSILILVVCRFGLANSSHPLVGSCRGSPHPTFQSVIATSVAEDSDIVSYHTRCVHLNDDTNQQQILFKYRGGGGLIPSGWNPFGYQITELGLEFLKYDGSLEGDVGRFIASLKSSRKTVSSIKANWLEIVRVAKTGQSMRIYRSLDELIKFALKAGFID
jgi:hypothetical protein